MLAIPSTQNNRDGEVVKSWTASKDTDVEMHSGITLLRSRVRGTVTFASPIPPPQGILLRARSPEPAGEQELQYCRSESRQ